MITHDVDNHILMAGYIASMEAPLIREMIKDVDFNEFKEKLENFDVLGIVEDKPTGIVFFDGNHAHISILKEYHGKCGIAIKQALEYGLDKYQSLIGTINKNDERAIRFVKKLGFIKIGYTNEFNLYYRAK